MTDEIKSTAEEQDKTLSAEVEKSSTASEQEKTFTQAELDRIISERIARERKNLPDEADLKAFKEWKKAQQTEAERTAEREKKYAEIEAKAETIRRENLALKAGVNIDDVDYVLFKVGKMDGDFEANLQAFLAENEKFSTPKTTKVEGATHERSKGASMDGVEAAFLKKNPDLKINL